MRQTPPDSASTRSVMQATPRARASTSKTPTSQSAKSTKSKACETALRTPTTTPSSLPWMQASTRRSSRHSPTWLSKRTRRASSVNSSLRPSQRTLSRRYTNTSFPTRSRKPARAETHCKSNSLSLASRLWATSLWAQLYIQSHRLPI